MSDNLSIWKKYADIDPQFTKPITGKQYKGTSPNPQYVIQCLTDMFGPVGQGFGWRVIAEAFTPLGEEVLHWCRIEFWHTDRANVIESYGQTKAAYKTSGGKYMVDEDAPKKSLTDAIVKAASYIGVGASIFLGRWDDQKYVAEVNAEYRADEKKQSEAMVDGHHENAVVAARMILEEAQTVDEIKAAWKKLSPAVRADPRVINDGSKRKAELQSKPADDLGGDILPY